MSIPDLPDDFAPLCPDCTNRRLVILGDETAHCEDYCEEEKEWDNPEELARYYAQRVAGVTIHECPICVDNSSDQRATVIDTGLDAAGLGCLRCGKGLFWCQNPGCRNLTDRFFCAECAGSGLRSEPSSEAARATVFVAVLRHREHWGTVLWGATSTRATFEEASEDTEDSAELNAAGAELDLGAVRGEWNPENSWLLD